MTTTRVKCLWCKKPFVAYNREIRKGGGKYCSVQCGNTHINKTRKYKPGTSRATISQRARNVYIKRYGEPYCLFCGEKADVHHINGNKTDNRKKNMVALCRSCHITHHNENGDTGIGSRYVEVAGFEPVPPHVITRDLFG